MTFRLTRVSLEISNFFINQTLSYVACIEMQSQHHRPRKEMCCCTSIPSYRDLPCKRSYFCAFTKVSAARTGLRYPIHKQVNSSTGWIIIPNQHKWNGKKRVIHQSDSIDQNQNNTRKAMEYYSHCDHYVPLKTTNWADLVSSWNSHPKMAFSNKTFTDS